MSNPVGMFVRKIGKYFVAAESDDCAISHESVRIASTWGELEEVFKTPPTPSMWGVELHGFEQQGQIIQCIKIVREYTGLGLKESKDIVDCAKYGSKKTVIPTHSGGFLAGNSLSLAAAMADALCSFGCHAEVMPS